MEASLCWQLPGLSLVLPCSSVGLPVHLWEVEVEESLQGGRIQVSHLNGYRHSDVHLLSLAAVS